MYKITITIKIRSFNVNDKNISIYVILRHKDIIYYDYILFNHFLKKIYGLFVKIIGFLKTI